jgi:hypothetical protein
MDARTNGKRVEGLVGGLILMVLGAIFLLDGQGLWAFDGLRGWWPLIVIAIAVGKLIGADTGERRGGGLWLLFVGAWLLANTQHVFGLRWHTSWPILIIGLGVMMTVKALYSKPAESPEVGDGR